MEEAAEDAVKKEKYNNLVKTNNINVKADEVVPVIFKLSDNTVKEVK